MLKDVAVRKIAVIICNGKALRNEIFCEPGSDIDRKSKDEESEKCKELWDEVLEEKAIVVLNNLGLPKSLIPNILSFVHSVGRSMLNWAKYQGDVLSLTPQRCMDLFNIDVFSPEGIVDSKKFAKQLVKDRHLSIEQRFKLSCMYCLTDDIAALFGQMTEEERMKLYDPRGSEHIHQHDLVKYWSYHLMSNVDKLRGPLSPNRYRLKIAIESGIKEAVEYCFERESPAWRNENVVNVALEALEQRRWFKEKFRFANWDHHLPRDVPSVPIEYLEDIVFSLLSQMTYDQRRQFLLRDILRERNIGILDGVRFYDEYGVLELFLNWPYQKYFLETVNSIWENLPEWDFAILLFQICDKIDSRKGYPRYGEERMFDYRNLLVEVWQQSPERFKRFVFSNQAVVYYNPEVVCKEYREHNHTFLTSSGLLLKLLKVPGGTKECRDIVRLLMSYATQEEKEFIIFSTDPLSPYYVLMREKKWKEMDYLLGFLNQDQADQLKRNFWTSEKTVNTCIELLVKDTLEATDACIKWLDLPEKELIDFKREMMNSEYGKRKFVTLTRKNNEKADEFIKWFLFSEEDNKIYKKKAIFCEEGIRICTELFSDGKFDALNEFISICTTSVKDIMELKQTIAYGEGRFLCWEFICGSITKYLDDENGIVYEFRGGRWEQLEMFLTWCFSSEGEIEEFKEKELIESSRIYIHFQLMSSSQWNEAEIFFAWLRLPESEVRELKRQTALSIEMLVDIHMCLFSTDNYRYLDYAGGNWERVELLLRWCLKDKETVLEFKDRFEQWYSRRAHRHETYEIKIRFDLLIGEIMIDVT